MPFDSDDILLEHETGAPVDAVVQDITPIPVIVMDGVVTSQIRPQSATASTYVLTATQPIAQIATLDPLRTAMTIVSIDQSVVLCHSLQQAQDPANQVVNIPNPNGLMVPGSATLPLYLSTETTQELWIVGNTFPSRVAVWIERRVG
jgi:hypothetical protein